MTFLLVLRHAPTAWNEARRIQGRTDEPLSKTGRALAGTWRLSPEFDQLCWLSSPLQRCRETARILVGTEAVADGRLVEMAWGEWEGRQLAELRRKLGPVMAENEARGLDFQPPGGESPRMVQTRLLPLLAEIAAGERPCAAVTHRGVIRALYAMATGWDMTGKPPTRLEPFAAHLFRLSPSGRPTPDRLNIPLHGRDSGAVGNGTGA